MKRNVLQNMNRRYLAVAVILVLACSLTACGEMPVEEEVKISSFVEEIPESEMAEDEGENTSRKTSTGAGRLDPADADALMKEALEDAGKDTGIVDGKYKTKGLTFEVPEGFTESEEAPNLYVTRRYPLDASNIYYCEREVDPSMQLMTKDAYLAMTMEQFKEANGFEMEYAVKDFKEIKIDGVPGFRVEGTFPYNELTITQITYIINADKTYILVYTMTNEYDKMELFNESEKTIHLKK